MYKREGFKELLSHQFSRIKSNDNNYGDIYDGAIYKELSNQGFLSNPNNIRLPGILMRYRFLDLLNLTWPFYFVINELLYTCIDLSVRICC